MLGRTTSEPDRLVPRTSYDVAEEAITPIAEAQKRKAAEQRAQRIAQPWDRGDLEKQVFRRWKAGDVYAPHDLTGVEQAKWKKLRRKGRSRMDVLDQLNINPIQHYKVCSGHATRHAIARLDANVVPPLEFQYDVRVYVGDGAYQTQQRDGSATCESAQDGESDSESEGSRSDARRSSTSRNLENRDKQQRPAGEIMSRRMYT